MLKSEARKTPAMAAPGKGRERKRHKIEKKNIGKGLKCC